MADLGTFNRWLEITATPATNDTATVGGVLYTFDAENKWIVDDGAGGTSRTRLFSSTYNAAVTEGLITVSGGGGTPGSAPDWLNPDATISATSTWTKPAAVTDDTWVWFYFIGGGGGGASSHSSGSTGGGGGNAYLLAVQGSSIPATLSVTIGGGGASGGTGTGGTGGSTQVTINGNTYSATGGAGGQYASGGDGSGADGSTSGLVASTGLITADVSSGSNSAITALKVFGASGSSNGPVEPTQSDFLGGQGGNNFVRDGQVPGGGGSGVNNGSGARGEAYIYWSTGQ